jgi:hypothetical protein
MRIAMIMAALLAVACGPTGTLTAQEEANLAAVKSHVAAYNAQEEGGRDGCSRRTSPITDLAHGHLRE